MKNIVVSIGGTGTKVAEALVRLLAVGFPLRKDPRGALTSAGNEEMEIWRVDTDQSSGAGDLLKTCLDEYRALQENLERGWSMRVNPNVVHLNPLALPRQSELDNMTPTLEGILNSGIPGRSKQKTQTLLDLFYTPEEQQEDISRGFYQKPFIGAPIMSVFANSLEQRVAAPVDNQDNAAAVQQVSFQQLLNQSVRFFLCGSLHGGTGASGIAVLGQFLKRQKQQRAADWQIAACLLAPYCQPPQPFEVPSGGAGWSNEKINSWFAENKPPAAEKFSTEEKVRAFRQIARGFYADLEDLNNRALHNLSYYESVLTWAFDQLYLVGKFGNMDQLPSRMWSNGGNNQRNPLNSAEVVAALTALRYFSGAGQADGAGPYIVASSNETAAGTSVRLHDLPKYEVAGTAVDPEKVFLATAVARHLVAHTIVWEKEAQEMFTNVALGKVYKQEPAWRERDAKNFAQAAAKLRAFVQSVLDVSVPDDNEKEMKAIGWNQDEVWKRLDGYLPTDPASAQALTDSFTGKNPTKVGPLKWGGVPPKPVQVGSSTYTVKLPDFYRWELPEDVTFSRGAYFRHVWWQVYQNIAEAQQPSAQ